MRKDCEIVNFFNFLISLSFFSDVRSLCQTKWTPGTPVSYSKKVLGCDSRIPAFCGASQHMCMSGSCVSAMVGELCNILLENFPLSILSCFLFYSSCYSIPPVTANAAGDLLLQKGLLSKCLPLSMH